MLKRLFSLIIAGAIMVGSAVSALAVDYGEEYKNQPTKAYSQVFSDVSKSHWAFSYIGEMNQRGVISGYPNRKYYPENNVTRAEFAKIMCVAAGLSINEVSSTSYYDVEPSEWYAPYIETGRYYLSGYKANGVNYYHPNDYALREDIAVALVKLRGYSTTGADESMLKAMFTDWQSVSTDARKFVAVALENGLISGYDDNTFRGQDSITRAEAATLLWRAYQYGNGNKTFDVAESSNQKSPVITELPSTNKEDEKKQRFTIDVENADITANAGDIVEINVTVKDNSISQSQFSGKTYLIGFSGDYTILSSDLEKETVNSDNSIRTTYTTDVLKVGNYEIMFSVGDGEERQTKKVTITVSLSKNAYSCDTLAKAYLSDTFMMATTDNNDNIYYYDSNDNTIYKLTIGNKNKSKLINIDNLKYDDISLVEKEVTKNVPKTVTKTITKEVPIEDGDETEALEDTAEAANTELNTNTEASAEPETKTITEEVTETVYETVTETVNEETVVGTYKEFNIEQIYYNTGNNMLLLAGVFRKYCSDTSLNDKSVYEKMIFAIKGTKTSLYTDKTYISNGIFGNFDDGKLITAHKSWSGCDGGATYYLINCDDFSTTNIRGNFDYTTTEDPRMIVVTNGSNVYSAGFSRTSATQSKYSFAKKTWDTVTTAVADFAGIKEKCFYYWDLAKGKIAKSNLDGKIEYIEGIDTVNNIDVQDFSNIPSPSYDNKTSKLFITKNESFVFYDSSAKAFRIIKKQK